jgi:uncharacterized Zn-binding protein involved in type VI secretion
MVSGMPTTTIAAPYVVAGCPMVAAGAPTPCVRVQWMKGATRVTSGGQPMILIDSQAVCVPNGTPVTIVSSQTRVTAQ